MTELTSLERLQELAHYVSVFNERAFNGTAYQSYDPKYPGVHNYAIQSPVRPQATTWQSTGTVPHRVASSITHFELDTLTPHELTRVHTEFDRMARGLAATRHVLEGRYTREAGHLIQNLDESLPTIRSFVAKAAQRVSDYKVDA